MGLGKQHQTQINFQVSKTGQVGQINQANQISNIPFIKVPNNIISYSMQYNKTILPLYLYSGTHAEVYNNNNFSFSLSFITSYFMSLQKRRGYINKFNDGLQVLLYGDEKNGVSNSFELEMGNEIDNENDYNSIFNKNERNIFDKNENPIFDKNGNKNPIFDKNEIITVRILDREVQIVNGWTPIYFDEFYYIINSVKQRNIGLSGKEEWNLIDLINIYCYIKYQIMIHRIINQTQGVQSTHGNQNKQVIPSIPYILNLKKISKLSGLGEKTIVKYIKELDELELVSVLNESQYRKKNSWQRQNKDFQYRAYEVMNIGEINDSNRQIKYGYNPKEKNIVELNTNWRDNNE